MTTNFQDRLNYIQNLPPGWFNGSGSPFKKNFISKVDTFIRYLPDSLQTTVYIYPFEDSLSLEWDFSDSSGCSVILYQDTTFEIVDNSKDCDSYNITTIEDVLNAVWNDSSRFNNI